MSLAELFAQRLIAPFLFGAGFRIGGLCRNRRAVAKANPVTTNPADVKSFAIPSHARPEAREAIVWIRFMSDTNPPAN